MKKGFTLVELIGVIIILGVLALITFAIIDKSIKNSKQQALDRTIDSIEKAAYNYSVENDIGYSTEYQKLKLSDLVSKGFLKENITNPVTDEQMQGCVLYKWDDTNNQYIFEYDEECEVPLFPRSLINILLTQYSEGNTTGLVKDSTNENLYYYKGTNEEVSNNFLWYGGHQWRVLEFDTSANTLTLITQQSLTPIQSASKVWTDESTYNSSYINTWLNDYFWNSLDSSIQSNIQKTTFNVGIYTDVDEITTEQNVGLLDQVQYLRSGDGTSAVDSFLDIKDSFLLGNRYSSSYVRYVYNDGSLSYSGRWYGSGVRAIIKISDITITGGDGTLTSNYQVENKATNTNNVQVGEYINVPYSGSDNVCGSDNMCTFRVVSKDEENNRIKVVLNGLLPTKSALADNALDNIITSDLIYTNVLNGFIENIDSKYITTGTYGVGMYEIGNSYVVPQSTTISANIGLPTIGEMFSGNDIDMAYPADGEKTFVDVNTIENPSVSNYYWTFNRGQSYSFCFVIYGGTFSYDGGPSSTFGVRPVIYLKAGTSSITFSGGKGTAQLPYVLQ